MMSFKVETHKPVPYSKMAIIIPGILCNMTNMVKKKDAFFQDFLFSLVRKIFPGSLSRPPYT